MKRLLSKHIAIPQDHGAWVFILSPLLIGAFTSNPSARGMGWLFLAAMAAFMLRQPVTVLIKTVSNRKDKTHQPAALFWSAVYGMLCAAAVIVLVQLGSRFVLYLAAPGIPVFIWHLWLVSQRAERRQAGIEIIATGVLSLAAPAAYWIGVGKYDPFGWWLWLFTWLQSAASIVYAYLRLAQRELKEESARNMKRGEWFRMGLPAFLFTSFNLALSSILGLLQLIPLFTFAAFLIQWLETCWGILNPAVGWKPVRIGVRQLIVSILWTVIFIFCWKNG